MKFYMRQRRKKRRAAGRCVSCSAPTVNRARCPKHEAIELARCKTKRDARRAATKCAYAPCSNPKAKGRRRYCSQACNDANNPRIRNRRCEYCLGPVTGRQRFCCHAHQQAAQYMQRQAKGLCIRCPSPIERGTILCRRHNAYQREQDRLYRERRKAKACASV